VPASLKIEMESDIAAFINRLEKYDKATSKELKKGMREGVKYVVNAAKKRIDGITPTPPLSNWGYSWVEQDRTENVRNLVFQKSKAKSGVKPAAFRARRRGSTVGFGYQAVQKNPAASIFELAGSQNAVSKQSRAGSRTFNRNLLRRFGNGPYPRIMYPSYYDGIKEARAEIEQALQQARRAVGL
jgi:hypothetical protein